MDILFINNWPRTTMKIWPNSIKILPKEVQNFAQYQNDNQKLAKDF